MKPMQLKTVSNERAFTLAELMIVIAIIALVATVVTTRLVGTKDKATVSATKIQMKQLGVVLEDFKLDCGFYPLTDQSLDALKEKPAGRECKNYAPGGYIKDGRIPMDGWSNPFLYESDGSIYEMKSLGADAKEGGDAYAKDISSKEID